MAKETKQKACWSTRTSILLLVLIGVGLWLYQSLNGGRSNIWSWEEQVEMEVAMAKAAQQAPGKVPEIDRSIPETETALFALG